MELIWDHSSTAAGAVRRIAVVSAVAGRSVPSGPSDPLVGLLPPDPLTGPGPGPRLGLWLSHQLVDLAHRHDPDGYTIRLEAHHPLDHTD